MEIRGQYDMIGLSKELELDLTDLASLFSAYIHEMKEEIMEVRRYLAGSDWVMLQRTIHNIKGVSANLRVSDVFKEAEMIDALLKEGNVLDIPDRVGRLVCFIEAAESKIRNYFKKEKNIEI